MIYVISKATFGSYNVRDIQFNANWDICPYSDYAVIPDSLVDDILATKGYCDIALNSDGTEVVSFTARTIPSVPEECLGNNTVLSVNGVKADSDGDVTIDAADVGAAPDGYGLGTTVAASTADINVVTPARFFKTTSSTANLPQASRNVGIAIPYAADEVAQLLIRTLNGAVRIRRLYNGVWTEEWVNPPMAEGAEYRTTERWNGKPVFTMLINCGAATNKMTISYPEDVAANITGVIRYAGKVGGQVVPAISSNSLSNAWTVHMAVGTTNAALFCGTSMEGAGTYLQIWYTRGDVQ